MVKQFYTFGTFLFEHPVVDGIIYDMVCDIMVWPMVSICIVTIALLFMTFDCGLGWTSKKPFIRLDMETFRQLSLMEKSTGTPTQHFVSIELIEILKLRIYFKDFTLMFVCKYYDSFIPFKALLKTFLLSFERLQNPLTVYCWKWYTSCTTTICCCMCQ